MGQRRGGVTQIHKDGLKKRGCHWIFVPLSRVATLNKSPFLPFTIKLTVLPGFVRLGTRAWFLGIHSKTLISVTWTLSLDHGDLQDSDWLITVAQTPGIRDWSTGLPSNLS